MCDGGGQYEQRARLLASGFIAASLIDVGLDAAVKQVDCRLRGQVFSLGRDDVGEGGLGAVVRVPGCGCAG